MSFWYLSDWFMETFGCSCDWDTFIAVAFQHYGHDWGFPEQGLRQISMSNCGFDAERRSHYHTQICYRVGCRSALGGRERTCGSLKENRKWSCSTRTRSAPPPECATRALRERDPWRHLVSGRHRFVISVFELRALIWPTRHVSVSLVGPKPASGARIVA